ncbi:replication protein C domain-containing protein [Rhizobium sp. DKSPLA3]|uniref:Replication protein C domain-containing protein n=1 Tax=Rhizobium quercicola TaxID=2901226 RepID=A0A9X1T763_9HYPH|nr:plasmid replication protein RepC [Rhizobium quercicola]MCD7109528.1 replication protein C domain-containing protein [Rhizobium quercicola]
MERFATTPFGGARLTARNFALRADLEKRQARLRDGECGNTTGQAEKYGIIRALSEARTAWNLSDRAIAVLEALASFHQDRHLDGRAPIIVFPSNAELSLRARGMSPATLRRHLASLVDAGLILRRDSANGKRYCRRDDHGDVETAFGFDLAPLALRAEDILATAAAARDAARRISRLRAEITLHLRDIAKTIAAALAEGRTEPGAELWQGFIERLRNLSGRVQRNGTEDDLSARRDALVRLRAEVETAYLAALTDEEMSANDHQSEHHIQTSKSDHFFDKNGQRPNTGGEAGIPIAPERKSAGIALKDFLGLCPDIADYARGGVSGWQDVIGAAEVVRSMLGISPSAWAAARAAMGPIAAAIVLAAILQRSSAIRSPGGYLRDLTAKAEQGRFSIGPMLKALG